MSFTVNNIPVSRLYQCTDKHTHLEEHILILIFNNVHVDGLALLSVKTFVGTVITKFRCHIWTESPLEGFIVIIFSLQQKLKFHMTLQPESEGI